MYYGGWQWKLNIISKEKAMNDFLCNLQINNLIQYKLRVDKDKIRYKHL